MPRSYAIGRMIVMITLGFALLASVGLLVAAVIGITQAVSSAATSSTTTP